jgi:ParB-like chromosome segregation protein Spo0J
MKIEMWPIDRPIPYDKNPRKNDGAAVGKVKVSIATFGFLQPIVCDEHDVILAGHTRHRAGYELGMMEVPVLVATGLSPAQAKAYRLADNRVAEESSWANDLLSLELNELQLANFDLNLLGFNPEEMATLFAGSLMFEPSSQDDQGKLDEKTKVCCPKCGHEFAT